MTVPKYCFTRSGWSRTALSGSVKMTPFFASSSLMLWYTISESYCAPTPARNFRSASGIPMRSKVSLMYAGTSSQLFVCVFRGLGVVVQVVEVEVGEVRAPIGHGLFLERPQGAQAELPHPLRLPLVAGDGVDDFLVQTLARLEYGFVGK